MTTLTLSQSPILTEEDLIERLEEATLIRALTEAAERPSFTKQVMDIDRAAEQYWIVRSTN